jgi:MEDS: MEthanogen/methylotroph, DcmR Sensory domain
LANTSVLDRVVQSEIGKLTMSSAAILPASNFFAPSPGSRCPELLRLYKPESSSQHLVQFYEDESSIVENVAYLAARTLASGDSSVVVATETHLEQIRQRLASSSLDLNAARDSGRYVTVDAARALSKFMVDGQPDKAKFDDTVGGIVRNAARNSSNGFVFAFGEMVGLLCAANNPDAAVRLEQLWNALAEQHRFSLYCAYSLSSLGREPDANALIQICAEHALTIPTETSL